jgi:serine/threonine protein kinase
MSDIPPLHPSRDLLEAYGLGKLGPANAAAVETHLAECDLCGRVIQVLPADPFVALVRRAVPAQEMSLADMVAQRGRLPPGEACVLVRQAALALQAIPEPGLARRDISPEGLVRLPDGRVEVRRPVPDGAPSSDPGAVTLVPRKRKPDYLAPEQVGNAGFPDILSVVYSLGCVFHFLLFGQPPSTPGTFQPPGDLPAALALVLGCMLEPDPARRYPTLAEVAEALNPLVATELPS